MPAGAVRDPRRSGPATLSAFTLRSSSVSAKGDLGWRGERRRSWEEGATARGCAASARGQMTPHRKTPTIASVSTTQQAGGTYERGPSAEHPCNRAACRSFDDGVAESVL